MMRKTLTTLTGAALLAGMASFSAAQPGREASDVLGNAGAMERPHAGHGPQGAGHGPKSDRPQRPALNLQGAGADVALACIESMGETRKAAMAALRERIQSGMQAVRTLSENEAPSEAVELAAQQARESIGQAAIRADMAISSAALECVQTLLQNGAEQKTIFAVIRAREGNQKAVHFGAMRAGRGLHMAVRAATGEIDGAPEDRPPHRRGFRGHRGPRGPDATDADL